MSEKRSEVHRRTAHCCCGAWNCTNELLFIEINRRLLVKSSYSTQVTWLDRKAALGTAWWLIKNFWRSK